ncbi:hypothetical protein A7U60_g5132 [Sanghuangporus baumii]|uniref:Uncharacterized protein n=1 Tax=Sanghuangporus baumii TaxID=108892 RepID=A0A9Q5HXG5_SANBA|nr:hypothetical protein A7U60_g5132 [Sanghuangporus baumii]
MSSQEKEPPESASPSSASSTVATRVEEANRKLESTAQASVNWGVRHERQIQEFEAELASALSNSRAVHNLLVEALGSIELNRQRVDRALLQHIPHIYRELNGSMVSLSSLQDRLPELRSHVRTIRAAYDSGRNKAQVLTSELEWKRMPVQDKIWRVAFARGEKEGVPVRRRDVWLTRMVLVVLALLLCWQLASALDGAYRAYRHRLVWGDKLIS